ncbi:MULTISPECIES: hypothetical protein, partial [unclassified Bradyrhizobium]|uniref:hypothetical protein n=2 Tax=Bradyrhizobium TaxID=374 RepID=UPI0029163CD2
FASLLENASINRCSRYLNAYAAFPARWVSGLYAIFPGIGSFAPVICATHKRRRKLSASTEAPEPRDFTVRDAPLVRANQVRAQPATSTAFLSHATDDPDAPLE